MASSVLCIVGLNACLVVLRILVGICKDVGWMLLNCLFVLSMVRVLLACILLTTRAIVVVRFLGRVWGILNGLLPWRLT